MLEFIDYFRDTLIFFSIVIAIIYCWGFTVKSKAFKFFTFYLVFISLIQILLFYFSIVKMNSIFLFHFYFIGQFVLLSLFYKELLKMKYLDWISIAVLLYLGIDYLLNPNLFFEYHTYGVLITQGVVVFYSLIFFYRSLSRQNEFIYINTGILIYFMTSILFFGSGNLILRLGFTKDFQKLFGVINDVLYLLFQILIFIEWYRNYKIKN